MADYRSRELTFAAGFSAALAQSGLTLKELAIRLKDAGDPVAHSTLSYWRSGGRYPSRSSIPAITAIERILGTNPGELVWLVTHGTREPTVLPFAEEKSLHGEGFEPAAADLLARLGETHDLLASTMLISRIEFDKDLRRGRHTVHKVERAASGVDVSSIVSLFGVAGSDTKPPRILGAEGVDIADYVVHPSGNMFGYRLEFPEPVRRGEYVEYSLTMDAPFTSDTYRHAFTRPVRSAAFTLAFPPDHAPEWIEEFEQETGRDYSRFHHLDGRHTITICRHGFGPGILALRWGSD